MEKEKLRVLVTGGSGFIGTNFIDYLTNNNIKTLNIDINPPKNKNFNKFWEEVDIRNLQSLRHSMKKFNPTHIVHLAAALGMEHKSLDTLDTNTEGVKNIINISNNLSSLKKIIFTSSLLVCKNGYIPLSDTDYCPPNFYGKSKMLGEQYVRSSQISCEWAIVRPTSIWGPWFDYSYKSFFKMIDRNMYMHIGNQDFEKPASFVGNAVYMIVKILFNENNKINKGTFYLADYPWYSTRKWSNTIQKILNVKNIKTAPLSLLKLFALIGDLIKILSNFDPPLTRFRLRNMMTGGSYPILNTKEIVGELPYDLKESTFLTAEWMYKNKMINHKPSRL